MKKILFAIMLAVTAATLSAAITVPRLLNYQGKLANPDGSPVRDSTYALTLRLFPVETGGTAIWTEAQSITTISGIFNCLLGSVAALPDLPADGNCWLEVQMPPEAAIQPRVRITSTAYSFLAENSARLEGRTVDSLDARYVNEGQAKSVSGTMLRDSAIADAHVAPAAGIKDTKLAGTGTLVSNFNSDLLDGYHSSQLVGLTINRIIRDTIIINSTYGVTRTKTFSPSINPAKSLVHLQGPVAMGIGPGYAPLQCAVVGLTASSITLTTDSNGYGWTAFVAFEIVEYQ